jgi:CheY-like chemotaxis protein
VGPTVKVLVVDDEPDVELLFRQKFRREVRGGSLELHFARSGEEALTRLAEPGVADVVLILSDINMPGMHGLELLRRIKEQSPELKVCMITAYDDSEKYETAMRYGADGYVTKPIDFERLRREVLRLESGGR